MKATLAVLTPQTGLASETFIRRHAVDLLPGRTAVIAGTREMPTGQYWTVPRPAIYLDEERRRLINRLAFRLSGKLSPDNRITAGFIQHVQDKVVLGEYLDWSWEFLPSVHQRLGIPFYAHAHGYDVSIKLREPQWRRQYKDLAGVAGIVLVSDYARKLLMEIGVPAEKLHVIPCGVEIPSVAASPSDDETLRCIAVGRLVGKKAPVLLLAAFRRAAERDPRLHLDLVGAGPHYSAVYQYRQEAGLTDRVTLHGALPHNEVLALFARSHLFLQHSVIDPETGDTEGLPVSILEAGAHGLPVVTTRHVGIPEAVLDGKTGLLVEEYDTAAMAEAILRLAREANLRQDLGEAARERIREKFSWVRERCDLLALLGLSDS